MRSLFYLLVLANLAFAAWAAWFSAPAEPSSVSPRVAPSSASSPATGSPDAAPRPSTRNGGEEPSRQPAGERVETRVTGEGEPTADAGATRAAADDATSLAAAADAARFAAASEQSPEAAPPRAAESTESLQLAVAPSGAPVCTMIGPFSDRATAEAAADSLGDDSPGTDSPGGAGLAGGQARIREADGDVWLDYWVNLSSLATREQTSAAIATLRDGGFDDAYMIRGDEEGGDIISLGVFREMSRAERLSGQIRALGLTPSIVDRFRPGTVYWLVIEPAAAGAARGPDLQRGLESLRDLPDGPRLEARECTPSA